MGREQFVCMCVVCVAIKCKLKRKQAIKVRRQCGLL